MEKVIYNKTNWIDDDVAEETPIEAKSLNNIEIGIKETSELANELVDIVKDGAFDLRSLIDNIYPVGSIYQTEDKSFKPNVIWGGTWERVIGRVLVGVDEENERFSNAGFIGGSEEVELKGANNGPHKHAIKWSNEGGAGTGLGTLMRPDTTLQPQAPYSYNTVESGNGTPHENMPPFYTVFIWKRVS